MITESKKKASIACRAIEDKKGVDLTVIDIAKVSTLADYFIIASGRNDSQVRAILDGIDEGMTKAGYDVRHTEGKDPTMWMLLDYGDVVIHIFNEEGRSFYDLEHLWKDGTRLDAKEFLAEEE